MKKSNGTSEIVYVYASATIYELAFFSKMYYKNLLDIHLDPFNKC